VEISQTAGGLVIRLEGEARVECAGALLDALFAPAARRAGVVTLELSELRSVSCLALSVLRAYRRGILRSGGQVRLTGVLRPAVQGSLIRAGLFDLFATSADAGPAPSRRFDHEGER
jgi:anti-anti-sigma factor